MRLYAKFELRMSCERYNFDLKRGLSRLIYMEWSVAPFVTLRQSWTIQLIEYLYVKTKNAENTVVATARLEVTIQSHVKVHQLLGLK